MVTSDDTVVFEVTVSKAILRKVQQALTIRAMAAETSGVIEAFIARLLEDIGTGGGIHQYPSGVIQTKVIKQET